MSVEKSNLEQCQTITDLSGFMYKSFFFSQGDGDLHKDILSYGGQYYAEALDTLTPDETKALKAVVVDRVLEQATNGAHRKIEDPDAFNEAFTLLFSTFLDPESLPEEERIVEPPRPFGLYASAYIIGRDYDFLVTDEPKGGRPNRGPLVEATAKQRFLSHFIHFGLLQNKTGNPVLDRVFAEAVEGHKLRLLNPDLNLERANSFVVVEFFDAVREQHLKHYSDEYAAKVDAALAV